jgi:putative peptide zinc metalloprotease protein
VDAPNPHHVLEPSTAALQLRDDLVFTPDVAHEPPHYTIEDPLRGKFYRVGMSEFTLISLLDGRRSVAEAVGLAAQRLGERALAEHEALALCRWLADCQLALPVGVSPIARLDEAAEKGSRQRLLAAVNPLLIRVPVFSPDRLLATLSPWLGWLFSVPMLIVWSGLVLYAMCVVGTDWSRFSSEALVILDRGNWLRLVAAWVLLKVLHESAHGLACKKYGGTVPSAGVALILLAPLAYIDVTSSWRLASKWQRIVTAAAGMYAELLVAAVAAIVWSRTPAGPAHCLAFNVAMTAGITTLLFNGNPLVRFDGYFILSDLLDVPNLYSASQQYVLDWIQKHVLGCRVPVPAWPKRCAWIIKLYAVAALAWRALFFLTLALSLVGLYSYLGVLLALALVGFGWGVPAVQAVRRLAGAVSQRPVSRLRMATTAAIVLASAGLVAVLLTRPGRVEAPAVVEYSPLTVIRAATPGFVREVRVASGDAVEPGQVIAVLENEELLTDLAELRLALQQSAVKGRMNSQNGEMAKCQVEAANRQSLEKKIAETRSRVEALTVRSPGRGTVMGKDIATLAGRYLQPGAEIAVVGDETTKQLIVAVPQDDVDVFAAQAGSMGGVYARTIAGDGFPAWLSKLDPRGGVDLPHPSLAAPRGGPLAVKVDPEARNSPDNPHEAYQLLTPMFTGKADLSPEYSSLVHCGQRVTVSFQTASETAAVRWFRSLQRWISRYTSPQPTAEALGQR